MLYTRCCNSIYYVHPTATGSFDGYYQLWILYFFIGSSSFFIGSLQFANVSISCFFLPYLTTLNPVGSLRSMATVTGMGSTDGAFEKDRIPKSAGDPTRREFTYFMLGGARFIYASAARLALIKVSGCYCCWVLLRCGKSRVLQWRTAGVVYGSDRAPCCTVGQY